MPKRGPLFHTYHLLFSDAGTVRRTNRFLTKHKLLIFLCVLLSLLLCFPFIYSWLSTYTIILELFFSALLIAGVYLVSSNRQLLTIAILFALLTITVIWFNTFLQSHSLFTFGLILEILYFVLTTIAILSHVLRFKKVTADKIYGAISGYLLIGVVWALVYTTIEHMTPNSFAFAYDLKLGSTDLMTHTRYFVHFIYYSFVTLTTLGYGDVTPLTNVARAMSSMEAVTGQLYIAVLVARLVGLHISSQYVKEQKRGK